MASRALISSAIAALAAALGGCGGGLGVGAVGSTPPPPQQIPTNSDPVEIFQSPRSQEFAVFSAGETAASLRIRYDSASGRYDVMVPGRDWEALIDDPLSEPLPGRPNQNFVFASGSANPNASYFILNVHYRFPEPAIQYRYSNFATWGLRTGIGPGDVGFGGTTAFGIPTAAADMPRSGAATFNGLISGAATIDTPFEDHLAGTSGIAPADVSGDVQLNFDFGAGTLAGFMHPTIHTADLRDFDLGRFDFADTVYATGSTSYSGRFATDAASGPNGFSGQFTGPGGAELIGKWAVPVQSPIDQSWQSMSGVWIAKQ